jgi:hypothetical protein
MQHRIIKTEWGKATFSLRLNDSVLHDSVSNYMGALGLLRARDQFRADLPKTQGFSDPKIKTEKNAFNGVCGVWRRRVRRIRASSFTLST